MIQRHERGQAARRRLALRLNAVGVAGGNVKGAVAAANQVAAAADAAAADREATRARRRAAQAQAHQIRLEEMQQAAATASAAKAAKAAAAATAQQRKERLRQRRGSMDAAGVDVSKECAGRAVYASERRSQAATFIQAHARGRTSRRKLAVAIATLRVAEGHLASAPAPAVPTLVSKARAASASAPHVMSANGLEDEEAPSEAAEAAPATAEAAKAAESAAIWRAQRRAAQLEAHRAALLTRRETSGRGGPQKTQGQQKQGQSRELSLMSRAEARARARETNRSAAFPPPLGSRLPPGECLAALPGAAASDSDCPATSPANGIKELETSEAESSPSRRSSTRRTSIGSLGAGLILGRSGPETGWSRGKKWKRLQVGKDQLILAKRWHKDVDRWYKRVWLQCKVSHTLLAGLLFRGTAGFSRAQTVQILMNSLALEIVVLCMQYTDSSKQQSLSINLVQTFTAGFVSACITVPGMALFAAAFNWQIVYNFTRWLVRAVLGCPGNLWRRRGCIARALFCWPCGAYRKALELVHAAEEYEHRLMDRLHSRGGSKSSHGKRGKANTAANRRKKTAMDAYREKMAEIEKAAATPMRLPAPGAACAPGDGNIKRSLEAQALADAYARELGALDAKNSEKKSKKTKGRGAVDAKQSGLGTTASSFGGDGRCTEDLWGIEGGQDQRVPGVGAAMADRAKRAAMHQKGHKKLFAGGLLDQRRSTDEPVVANEDIDFSALADAGLLDSGERQVWKKMLICNS